jgi:Gas vesicle protein K
MSRGQELRADAGVDTRAPATPARAGIEAWPEEHEPAQRAPAQRRRIDADPESVERGLVSLVLTVVELLRQLMERQALRRVDQGTLSDDQVENIGRTLMALESRMAELREHFGLTPEDLNLDLGPLGPLLPYE